MGCFNSKEKASFNNRHFVTTHQGLEISNLNLNTPNNSPVTEYPFYKTRLQPIEWQKYVIDGMLFEDPNFKADVSSIFDPTIPKRSGIEDWSQFVWKRPQEVYGDGNYTLYNKIDPNDTKQGQCGDCYFLSSLSSLAEDPEKIKNIFLQDSINSSGCYAVQFFICGEKRTVVVDDRFPYNESKQQWAFSRPSSSNEIWVLILEKAWAKVFGNYQRIEGGSTDEALHPLTGCPAKNFLHENIKQKELFWQTILLADSNQFPMCSAVASQMQEQEQLSSSDMKKVGLVDGHAYSMISAKEIQKSSGQVVKLCLIRNPWGKKEWNGDWSDSSPLWDEQTKSQVPNFQVANDGCFWISFEDYLKFFYLTTICFYKIGYKDLTNAQICDEQYKGSFGISRLILHQDAVSPVVITLDQINSRFPETLSDDYQYAPIKLVVTKVVHKTDSVTGAVSKTQVFVDGDYTGNAPTVSCAFKQGLLAQEYLIMYSVEFEEYHPQKKIVLSVYCEETPELMRLDPSDYGLERFSFFNSALAERMQDQENSIELI